MFGSSLCQAFADDPAAAPAGSPGSAPVTDNSTAPISPGPINPNQPSQSQNSQNSPNSQNGQNSQNPGDLPAPGSLNPSSANSPVPNTPLLPQQAGNPYTPFSLNSPLSPAQSPQITSPQLYTTGATDLSQIATNTGLRQAFSDQPSTTGFLSEEQEGGYSYPPIERLRLGPIDVKGAIVTSLVNDDNLRTANSNSTGGGQKEGDTSYSITPAVLLEYGAHEGQRGYATVVYSPTFTRFFHYSDQDSDDQNVAFNAQYPFQRLTLNAAYTYSETTGLNTDLNTRTTQTSNQATFGGTYDIDEKMSLSVQAQEVITSFSGSQNQEAAGQNTGTGDETSSLNNTLTYQMTDKVSFGPSLNVGVDKPKDSPQQTFEQALLGVKYVPTEKITLFAQGGVEFRQYDAGDNDGIEQSSGDETNPIFSVGAGYSPFDSTTLTLNASQSVHSSVANSIQTVVNSTVGVSATQRFFQRVYLNLTFDYTHEDTSGSPGGADEVGSEDEDQLTYRASLSIAPTAWSSASIYYQYLDNESDQPGNSYYDNQFGIALSAQF